MVATPKLFFLQILVLVRRRVTTKHWTWY